MKSRFGLTTAALASLLAIAAVFVFRPLPTTITRENAARLKPGMTVADVVSILGEPRDETLLPPEIASIDPIGFFPRHQLRRWVGESVIIDVKSRVSEDGSPEKVVEIEVANREFESAWGFVHWRVLRVLGLAPDRPLPVETYQSIDIL